MLEAPDFDPIDNFLQEADKRLRGLPAERRNRALAEAETHLRERAAEVAENGALSRQSAAAAVNAFGDPKSWASAVAQTSYTNRFTMVARWLTLVSAAVLVSVPIVSLIADDTTFWENASAIPILTAEAAFVGVFIGSLLWRQYHPRLLLGATAIAVVAGFLASVIDTQIGVRREGNSLVSFYQQTQRHVNQADETLQFGLSYYQSGKQQPAVPSRLLDGSRYIVPFDYRTAMYVINGNDAKPARTWSDPFVYSSGLNTNPRFNVVATETQAKAVWRAQAPLWLRYGVPHASAKIASHRKHIYTLGIVSMFSWFMTEFIYFGPLGMWLLVLLTHFCGVPLGRGIFRWKQRLRRAE